MTKGEAMNYYNKNNIKEIDNYIYTAKEFATYLLGMYFIILMTTIFVGYIVEGTPNKSALIGLGMFVFITLHTLVSSKKL